MLIANKKYSICIKIWKNSHPYWTILKSLYSMHIAYGHGKIIKFHTKSGTIKQLYFLSLSPIKYFCVFEKVFGILLQITEFSVERTKSNYEH